MKISENEYYHANPEDGYDYIYKCLKIPKSPYEPSYKSSNGRSLQEKASVFEIKTQKVTTGEIVRKQSIERYIECAYAPPHTGRVLGRPYTIKHA